ncbi:serine carboxypeptidase II-2, partial [Tanacetum coccineum]
VIMKDSKKVVATHMGIKDGTVLRPKASEAVVEQKVEKIEDDDIAEVVICYCVLGFRNPSNSSEEDEGVKMYKEPDVVGDPGVAYKKWLTLAGFNQDGKLVYLNPYSYNTVANLLFRDFATGIGYSYSNRSFDTKSNRDKRTAEDSLQIILNRLERFPQYKGKDLYITGRVVQARAIEKKVRKMEFGTNLGGARLLS